MLPKDSASMTFCQKRTDLDSARTFRCSYDCYHLDQNESINTSPCEKFKGDSGATVSLTWHTHSLFEGGLSRRHRSILENDRRRDCS